MAASTTTELILDMTPEEARALLEAACATVPGYEPNGDLQWRKGWLSLTNPVTFRAELMPCGDGRTTVKMTAKILALFDPFGFTREALDQFDHIIQAHAAVHGTDQLPATPLGAKRGLYVLVGMLGFGVGIPCLLGLCAGGLSLVTSLLAAMTTL